jgi:hypothetical protein
MSCWCDGDDPGCEVCQPTMRQEQRDTARALKRVTGELLQAAEKSGSAKTTTVLQCAALNYRIALEAYRRAHGP